LGILYFDSLDDDSWDRSVQPVMITKENDSSFLNVLNSNMDHQNINGYASQRRQSRFPSQIEVSGSYTVDFTGTPPKEMRFNLDAHVKGNGIKIHIDYPNAGSYAVYADNNLQEAAEWDNSLGTQGELDESRCGENRFVGVENFLEFYMTPGCDIKIVPKDSITCRVRLDWTLDGFYASNGLFRFADRIAAVLGIHASTIKTVAVYEGSVVNVFLIEYDGEGDEDEAQAYLKDVQRRLETAIDRDEIDFGAPILEFYVNE